MDHPIDCPCYLLTTSIKQLEPIGARTVYGLQALDSTGAQLAWVEDLSVDRDAVEHFLKLCNRAAVSLTHLYEVLEDYLALV